MAHFKDSKEALPPIEPHASVRDGTADEIFGEDVSTRNVGPLAIIAIGWNICNSWAAVAATMALSIANGGSVTLLYGLIVIFILGGSAAATLAELASVYPTAGGQYHWTSILAPRRSSNALSYFCGACNLFGWISLAAGFCVTVPQLVIGLAQFWHPMYHPPAWHTFLVLQFVNILGTAYNVFLMKRTIWIHDVGFVISIVSFITIFITCLATASPKQSSAVVWKQFNNDSGWSSDGLVFLTGLVNPNFIYSGLDGAIHLAEECKNASKAVPRALMSTSVIGFITAFAFAVAMSYSYLDFKLVVASPVPILEIWNQATRSQVAATIFLVTVIICGCFAVVGAQQTASRLTWSFARDDALIGARWLSKTHHRLSVPVWGLCMNAVIVAIMGCLYLGSATAFNAIISVGVILQQVSFAFPAALLLWRRRSSEFLPKSRSFNLGMFGWVANALTIVLGFISLIFYEFPTIMPVTAGNMNYACAIIGVMAVFTIVNWFVYARRRYHGPAIDMHSG